MDYEMMGYNRKRWNRFLLNGCWLIFALFILAGSIQLLVSAGNETYTVQTYIQSLIVGLGLLLAAELSMKLMKQSSQDYMLILISVLLTATIAYSYHTLTFLLFILVLPIMFSILYFRFTKLVAAMLMSLAALCTLYFTTAMQTTLNGLLAIAAMFLFISFIAWGIIRRGKEMMQQLQNFVDTNQKLFVQNIVMDKLSKTDSLTELYNHRSFHEFFERLVEQHERNQLSLQLAIIDIDNFKQINDKYGHRAGDTILQWVSTTLQSLASANDFTARYGGEEFAILFTDKTLEQALEFVEHMRTTIAGHPHDVLKDKPITVSIGLASYNGEGKELFFNRVDEALYKAKNSGKNKTVIASGPFDKAVLA